MPSSKFIPGRYPPPGTSQIADRIRERRGARGLSPLDGTLLHVPPVAEGWNSLLGAIRTKGDLPGDIRELMILRVAARNHAMFEWIHHEHVGRHHGLTTAQLYIIRDTSTLPKTSGILSLLQSSALAFADGSTKDVKVAPDVMASLQSALESWVDENAQENTKPKEVAVQDLLVEAAAVVATYNMVSRFLISLDIAGMSDELVPWPSDREEHKIPLPEDPTSYIYVVTHTVSSSAPWIVACNSLLTNHTMWEPLIPYLLGPNPTPYNVLLHDQRGHGASSIPAICTIPQLARDIAHILKTLEIPIIHSIIGVSQGGATALSFGTQFPRLTKSVVACDTAPRTAPGNKEAWESRVQLAKDKGINALANVTVPRWFPEGSKCYPGTTEAGIHIPTAGSRIARTETVFDLVNGTSIPGFEVGAGALMDYNLTDPASVGGTERSLLQSDLKMLLVAGSLDGGGKVGEGMKALAKKLGNAEFVLIEGSGHLPMIDETEKFWDVIRPFLCSV